MGIDRTRYLTIKEAAEKSKYDYNYLLRLVAQNKVACLEIDEHKRLIDYPDLERYIAEKPQRKPHNK